MRVALSLTLVLSLMAMSACVQDEEAQDPGFTSVFPDGSVFADGQLILPDGHVCIGVDPPESAYGASPGPVVEVETARPDGDAATDAVAQTPEDPPGPEDPCGGSPATCVGAEPPQWDLADFQPQSCGYEAVYGLDTFKGRPTVAVLLAAW